MSRLLLLAPGVALLAVASWAFPAPAREAAPLEALGRSLGGWRVAVVDVLALRADALERQGRQDEVPAVYETMAGLDPDNAAATEALADLLVQDGVGSARSASERFARWQDAWRMLRAGLVAHPDSALLAMRAGLTFLEGAERHPGLADDVDALVGGAREREATGIAFLEAAARGAEHLPRSGRSHLLALVRLGPLMAARALARGQDAREVRALLASALAVPRLHPAAVVEIEELRDPQPGSTEPVVLPLTARLEAHRGLLEEALRARGAGTPAALLPALDAVEAQVGVTPTTRTLRTWAASPGR